MWNRSAIHYGSRLVIDSSSCWTRVGDYTWCSRCRCTARLRRSVPLHSLSCIHVPQCVMSHLVVLQFLVAKGTHGCWTKVLLDLWCALQWQFIEEIRFHTLLCNCTRYSMKGRRSSSLSCGAWNIFNWVSMAGMRDTARQDNMIGLCLFSSSIADSKSAYTTTGAGISYRWLVCESQPSLLARQIVLITLIDEFSMCLYFVIMNGFARSEEVVTEPVLRVSCEMSILRINTTKDAMFEIAQVREWKHQSIESGYHSYTDVLHRSTVVGRGIVSDHRGEQIVVLAGKLQIGGTHQRWIHLDHLAISSVINHIPSIERSR